MPEAGGSTTQSGIYYQNTIAALYLGRMMDLRPRAARDQVTYVRFESPDCVDDTVVKFTDGSTKYIQAKENVNKSSDAWAKLWVDFADQFSDAKFQVGDKLQLVLGEPSNLAKDIQECCNRTNGILSSEEFLFRLSKSQKDVFNSIVNHLDNKIDPVTFTISLLSSVEVEIIPSFSVERDFSPLWIPETSVNTDHLLSLLRDAAGGQSRTRGSFTFGTLQQFLQTNHNIEIVEPSHWGASTYRETISKLAVIDIPGTNISKSIDESFPWPKASYFDSNKEIDFDDENLFYDYGVDVDYVDLSQFPTQNLDEVVVISGAGSGKSVLTKALALKLANEHKLPVIVSIPDLCREDIELMTYLEKEINSKFEINIDWKKAADAGLLVLLLDGLDEVSSSSRTLTLERIKTFVARYPNTAWLVTVRDASALNAPTNATLVELTPLQSDDIYNHILFYKSGDGELADRILDQLNLHQDIARLSKIPLFLALLISTIDQFDKLPSNRADLLENYLSLLFNPEQFKSSISKSLSSYELRNISQLSAFEALEREQLSVSSRLLDRTIAGSNRTIDVEDVKEQMVTHGLLKRTGSSLFTFPYPIVQEYLAGCYILENRPDEISERFSLAIKKPWAQAIQFALEQLQSPSELVEKWLKVEDDLFNTNLRLIARCIANGMAVSDKVKQNVSERLTEIWPTSSWHSRKRIGELICEILPDKEFPALRKHLSNKYLLNDGAGAITNKLNNHKLTEEILNELLEKDIEHLFHLYDLQPAVDLLGDKSLKIYIEKVKSLESADKSSIDALSSLIEGLKGSKISLSLTSQIYKDESLPLSIRMAVLTLHPSMIDETALRLIDQLFEADSYIPNILALRILHCSGNFNEHCQKRLLSPVTSTKQKDFIIKHFAKLLRSDDAPSYLYNLAHENNLTPNLKNIALVYSARFGCSVAMNELISDIPELEFDDLLATLSLLGHHRDTSIAKSICESLMKMTLSSEERTKLSSSLTTGCLYKFQMDYFDGGVLLPALPHPSLEDFKKLIGYWLSFDDYSPIDKLDMYVRSAELGDKTFITNLLKYCSEMIQENTVDFEDLNQSHHFGRALDILKKNQKLLSIEQLQKVSLTYAYNAASSAITTLTAIATRDALDALIIIYESSSDASTREIAKDSLEKLSGRLGLKISLHNDAIKVQSVH